MIPNKYPGEVAVVAGTGPSLTPESIQACNRARAAGKVRIFSCNRAHELFDTDVLHACNSAFYPLWWDDIKWKTCDKWTTSLTTQKIPAVDLRQDYPEVKYIDVRWDEGLSDDPSYICSHHGTGPQMLNIAHLYGCTKILLLGWDFRFPGKVSDQKYTVPRRYLGEDELTLRGWPKTGPKGERELLIKEMQTIEPAKHGIEVINCSPGTALKHFPLGDIFEQLQ